MQPLFLHKKRLTMYSWGHDNRYNDFPTYFRNKFQGRVQKISLDAGFSCPNRDGSISTGGCTYCNNNTFQPEYCRSTRSISEQINRGIEFFAHKYETMRFLAYFQSYTNTYAPLSVLKERYEESLINPKVIGLVIATRPDCLNDELLDYLQDLSKQYYVMIELGVESHNDETLNRINRGHRFKDSQNAIESIYQRGMHSCAHLIVGLPGESRKDFLDQAKAISQTNVENIKLHQLQVHKGTTLAAQYAENNEFVKIINSVDEYLDIVVEYLEYLRPTIIVERFVSSVPSDVLIAPKWGVKNFEFVAKLEKLLKERDTWQGKKYQAI